MKYERLRQEMKRQHVRGSDLALMLGIDGSNVSKRMTGAAQWTLTEAYKVLAYLGISPAEIYDYFPAGGESKNASGELTERERVQVEKAIAAYKASVRAALEAVAT